MPMQQAKININKATSIFELIYLFFLRNSKNDYYEKLINREESFPHLVRLIGSILLVVGIACLLYFQITDDELTGVVPL